MDGKDILTCLIYLIVYLLVYVPLSPGVLFTLPPNGSHFIVALVHGLLTFLFVVICYISLFAISALFEKNDDKDKTI